ncbi:Gamma-aminobutyrate:alpha-ketoglutarate aminotransferase [Bacillus paralicheniformis]|nr:Gamma-aminobutyrate:alpha-ketoglutarate aminotransferase [Bacillus paralicheniformis]
MFIGVLGNLGRSGFVRDEKTREPDKAAAAKIAKYANEHGLLLLTAGINGNIIRFLSPLVITDELLEEGFGIIEEALKQL